MITSFKREGNMIRVVTDHTGRNEFVYPADRFSSMAEIEAEINKSKALEYRRKATKEERVSLVVSSLRSSGARDDTVAVEPVVR